MALAGPGVIRRSRPQPPQLWHKGEHVSDSFRGWELLKRRVSRRGAFKAGTATAATVVITGVGLQRGSSAARAAALRPPQPLLLEAQDPHALVGQWSLAQEARARQQQGGPPRLTILPIDRAKFLAGARFDLRVEAENVDPSTAQIAVSIDNGGTAQLLAAEPLRSSAKESSLEAMWREVAFKTPGNYTLTATLTDADQTLSQTVNWQVVAADTNGKKAKNVILFIGDGMGQAPITAARIVSRGMTQGKYNGFLEIDTMDVYGHVTTSGMDSIATDSANSASAYATGHKTAVNAMGVYPDNTEDPNDDPRVENLAELLKRSRDMAIGLVTTSDVTDATPAAFFAHTRRRSQLAYIAAQAFEPERAPDVLMGGGYDKFIPQGDGSSRTDDRDLTAEAAAGGYSVVTTRAELAAAKGAKKLLGLFRPGNMNVYMDREVLRDPAVLGSAAPGLSPKVLAGGPWLDQPTLWETTAAAIDTLAQNSNGFFLMVEGASIDKQEHPLDWQRAVYDLIEMDQALGYAKRWAKSRGDTLIVVTADHNHSMSVVGVHDRSKGTGREGNGVYDAAGFPNFTHSNGDVFPDDPNPSRTLFMGFSNHPDFRENYDVNLPGPLEPALIDASTKTAQPNPELAPDAELQIGNLDPTQTNCVHTVDDIAIFAAGPSAQRFAGLLDNTEVFHGIVDALGLKVP